MGQLWKILINIITVTFYNNRLHTYIIFYISSLFTGVSSRRMLDISDISYRSPVCPMYLLRHLQYKIYKRKQLVLSNDVKSRFNYRY